MKTDTDADLESVIESVRGKQIIIMRNFHCWLPLVNDRNSFPTELGSIMQKSKLGRHWFKSQTLSVLFIYSVLVFLLNKRMF